MSPTTSTIVAVPAWRVEMSMLRVRPRGRQSVLPEIASRCNQFPQVPGRLRGVDYETKTTFPEKPRLPAAIQRRIAAQGVAQVNLSRPRNFLLGIEQHFFPLRDPAGSSRNSEKYGEHGDRETHGLVDEPSIEIDVGVELARYKIVVFQSNTLAFERDFNQRVLSHHIENFIG